jgi:DNA topoisomerase-6 subunit B
VWVPFTSESKEAIADYDEIRKEMKLALMECGRKLGTYLRKRQKMQREAARRDVFERYIGEIAQAINAINGIDAKRLYEALLKEARKRTAIADAQLDEEGKTVRKDETEELKNDEGVVMVESRAAHATQPENPDPGTPASAGVSSDEGDLVRLSGKPKKARKKRAGERD